MTGSPRIMSRDTQTGVNASLPPASVTLNAATPPPVTAPCEISNLNFECTGPQNGASTQRVPAGSSHVDIAPQLPASWKSTSSLQNNDVL